MKITKFVHSCVLAEMPDPVARTAIFDPGMMSEQALDVEALKYLDDIFITHEHPDHISMPLVKKLVAKFPDVHITAPAAVVAQLAVGGITATSDAPDGVTFFDAPHEDVVPLYPHPEEFGFHYLDLFSHPGDSHHFTEAKAILALPMTGPWGNAVRALNLALELKPKYIVPIHDWHWNDAARNNTYEMFEDILGKHGITFLKLETGVPVVIDL